MRTTTFVSATQLTAAIPASDIATAGSAQVTVMNPGGAISNALAFTFSGFTVSPTVSAPGRTVTATWSGLAAPTAADWIGLYARALRIRVPRVDVRQLLPDTRQPPSQRPCPFVAQLFALWHL